MNLALKDIRHGLFRFLLTCFGLGLLMTALIISAPPMAHMMKRP